LKTLLLGSILLLVTFLVAFFILGLMSRSGQAPGLSGGQLARCPDSPNCVCSEYQNDTRHYIEPMVSHQRVTHDTVLLGAVIRAMGGHIQTVNDHYLAATFSSRIFGFMDDVEIRVDPDQKVIHVRSASRVGRGDLGVNQQRIELLRKLYQEKASAADRERNKI